MNAIIAELLTVARKVNNYEVDPVTGLKVLWTATTVFQVVCPTDKRWFLLGGQIYRSVSSTLTVEIYDTTPTVINRLAVETAGTGPKTFPSKDYQTGQAFTLDAGEKVVATLGTAQDASAYGSCVVLEVDV